jgi:hypothetical protein
MRKTEVFTQGRTGVLGAKQPAPPKYRQDQLHEVVQGAGQVREYQVEPVRRRGVKPFLDVEEPQFERALPLAGCVSLPAIPAAQLRADALRARPGRRGGAGR